MATFQEVTEGLAVLARHLEKGMESAVTAQYGLVFVPDATQKALPALDTEVLERLGWRFDDVAGCWALRTLPAEADTGLRGAVTTPPPTSCDSL